MKPEEGRLEIAARVMKETGDESKAVREANSVVMKRETAKFKGESHSYSHKRAARKVQSRYAR